MEYDERKLKHEGAIKPERGYDMGRGRSRGPYGGRRQGLTGNQLKILGIVAILIDNIGADRKSVV